MGASRRCPAPSGRGRGLRRGSPDHARLLAEAFEDEEPPGTRQIVSVEVDLVQTSCGFGVPLLGYEGDRPTGMA